MPHLERVGPALELLMKRRAMSQRELAAAAGMQPAQLNRYLRGVKKPQLPSLERLLEALGSDLRELADVVDEVGGSGSGETEEARSDPPAEPRADTEPELPAFPEEPDPPPVASLEEAEAIRRRLRAEAEARERGEAVETVSEREFRSLLRRMILDAVAAQRRIDREEERLRRGLAEDDQNGDDRGSADDDQDDDDRGSAP